jgi:putative inorganic carbon (hco3(-)) transporter
MGPRQFPIQDVSGKIWREAEMRPVLPRDQIHNTRYRHDIRGPQESAAKRKESSVKTYDATGAALANSANSSVALPGDDARWNLAFAGLLFYAFIEYSRLPEIYPVFQVLHLGKIAIIFATLGYAVSPRVRRNGRPISHALDIAVLVFIFGNFLSACLASHQNLVWEGFVPVVYWGIVYFLMTRVLVSAWQIRVFLFLVLLLNLKLAQHTVRDYILHRSRGTSDMDIIMGGGAGQGSSSFFGNVADLGLAMGVVWGIVWALLVGKTEKKKLVRVFLIICFVLFFLAILFCGSRGAVVGAAAIVLVALARSRRKIGAVALAIFFVLGVWLVLPDASKERFSSAWNWEHDANASSRIMFWKAGLEMFADNPIFGVGPGNFAEVNPTRYVSHSLYIQVLAESGLVGTLSLAAMVVLFLRLNARTRKRALKLSANGRRSFEYCLAFGLDLALAGYMSSGAFLSVLYYPHLWILLGLSVAVNRCCVNRQPDEESVEKRSRDRNLALAAS